MKPESKNPVPGDDEMENPLAVPAHAPTDKPAAGDARDDVEKRKQNREHLDVNEAHKTPDMEEGHRGTYP